MSHNCPICGTSGLPDYKRESIVCHQCNSDLSSLYLINNIGPSSNRKRFIILALSICILITALIVLVVQNQFNNRIDTLKKTNEQLLDSLAMMSKSPNDISTNIDALQPESDSTIFIYKVKRGDYPYQLATLFYSDGSKYHLIEQENHLVHPYYLHVGQMLRIKLPKE
jgi:hypothetical protein